jgi:WD40 repeat protein
LDGGLSPDGRRLVVAGAGRNATVWAVDTGVALFDLAHVSHAAALARFSPDGTRILTAELRRLHLWDAATGAAVASIDTQGGFIDAAVFSRDGKRIATLDDQGSVRVWNAPRLDLVATLRGNAPAATTAAFSSDGVWVATAASDGKVRFWQIDGGRLVYELEAAAPGAKDTIGALAFESDRLMVAIGDTVDYWDAAPERRSAATAETLVQCLAPWQVMGRRLVEGPSDKCR